LTADAVAERLAQEIDCSSPHGHDRHRDIAMAGRKDDWNVNVRLGEQPDVED
jgi:hypothetical protein